MEEYIPYTEILIITGILIFFFLCFYFLNFLQQP